MEKSKKVFSKGKANQRSLADRMKTYEAVTTGTCLIEKLPIYARIDMRAGHSFCRGLEKPFDSAYMNAMKTATAYVVEETGAAFGYCQSDESSFAWADDTKIPFGTRLFKLESVLASMFTAAFFKACIGTKLERKLERMLPTFDCRVCNMPTLEEVANMLLWRERDSVKNSITLLALEYYSTKQIDKKNSDDKIRMLKDEKGVDYYSAVSEECRCGAYFHREVYNKILSDEELRKIPAKNWPEPNEAGMRMVTRSRISQFFIGMPLNDVENKVAVLFDGAKPIKRSV